MCKIKRIKNMLGKDEFDEEFILKLMDIDDIDIVFNHINTKYPDNCLYALNIKKMEAIMQKYDMEYSK